MLLVLVIFSTYLVSCKDDEKVKVSNSNFTVTIENVFTGKDYFVSGVTNVIMPGMSESFTFNAGKGYYLSFATMLVQSNDLFYAPNPNGIALYDTNGTPTTGDVTNMIDLWDAGTEVNEMPGMGENQPPRQSGENTGTDENGTIKLIADVSDGFMYPSTSDIIKIDLTHDGGTMFTATITNISNTSTLETPLAPGVWVVNTSAQTPIFETGMAASSGLERLAEDGNNTNINNDLNATSGLVSPFAPGTYGINDAVFTVGMSASSALEGLAEDGNPSGFTNIYNTPVGASDPGPIFPGESYSFSFSATDGDVLSLATMLVQSNDWFIGANSIRLFNTGTALSGDITSMIKLYDAGTESDEYAGAGNNQPPRQSAANTGQEENGTIATEMGTDNVPSISDMVKVTISSN